MKWISASALVAVVGCAMPVSVTAQRQASDSPESAAEIWILPRGSNPKVCNSKVATKVSLVTLAANGAQWEGRCVAVEGYWSGQALLADSASPVRVGVYVNKRLSRMAPREPRLYLAIGIAKSCGDWSSNVTVMGYCHASEGPYISVAQMRRR